MKFILLLLAAFVPYHESTLTVPFTFEIPNKVTSNRLVGQIKTVQAKKSQTFHIRHVVMSNENLPKENSNRNSVKSWETTALNKTKNDCDEETLKSYKGLRNMFCIDHKTGKIFTTKHITGASLNPGGGFSLEIIVQSGTSPGTIEERKWYTIHIVETCKYQLSRYKMVKECVNYKIPTKVKCYPKNNIDDVWVCPNITQSKPHYTIAHEVTIHRKITRTPIAFKYNEGPFRKIIRLIKSPHTERSIYTRSYTLINDTGFIYDDWTIFKNIFTDKFSIKQLIVSNQYDTCEKMDRCSDYINQIPNDITCSNFDINIFKEHTRRCKEKPKLQIKSANITIHLPHSSLKVIANTSYLETTKQLKLSIDSIDGPTLAGINITKPLQCNLNKSSNYFCIDENNGNIYTTIDWKNVPIRSVSYNIRVKAYDTTFPITSSVRTLRLTIKNNCSQDLSSVLRKNKCDAKLSKLISTKIMENKFMIFNSNVNPNAIFAAAISTKNIALNEGSQNVLTVMNHYKVNFTVNLKSPSVLLLPLQLSAHIPRKLSTAHNMNVTLKYFTPTGALRFHSLTKNSVKLLYTSSWSQCASDECFNIYNKWNGNQDPDDKINCQTPEDLYQEFYYKICTEIQPAFLFGPEISNETLKGCEYTSKLSFSKNAYWLINGTTRMNANITAVASATNRFKFSSWSLKNIARGVSYRCVVYDPSRMKHELRSEAVFFKKEIKAAFKRGPILNGSTMRGCEYTATMSLLSYTFWLINGTNKVNGTVEESTNKNLNNSFSFPKLIMDRFVPSTYYQCGIHYPDRMSKQLLSEKVYTDIDVRFVEGPKLVNTQLHGCSYNSSIPLNAYLYWLVNGTIKEKGTHSISSISTQSESNEYKFSQLDIINHSPGSFYQCVIFYPSRMAHMIVSERIYPDIQDINPIFINQPSLNGTILQGCDYKANISLHKYAYWLINGTKKVNGISVNKTSFSEVHDFPDLQILHYDATNFYQCVLYYPNRMKKIVKSLVITPDIRDINPTFITQPYLNGSILSGCSYKSDISLHEYTFWLINDSEVFQTTTSDPMSTTEKDLYNFPEYVIREFKPNTFYQCGVYYSKRMKGIELSDKIYTDIHPEFTNDPYLNGTKLQGCDYNADIPMQQYAYWLINGTIRMNGTSVHNSSFDISYRFPTLSILDYYPTTSYECILYHPHRMPKMIRSLKITPDIRNIKVTFVTQPRLNQNTLSGCSYNSNISMHDFTFWLINGSEVFQKTTSSPLSTAEKDLYNFPELVIRDFKPNTFYQCGVYNSKRMKGIELSKKIYTDIHPEFTNDPYLNGTKLQGCDYNADIPMQQYAYWLINGTIRMNGTSVHNSSSEISYRFPTLSILDYYPTTSYECILYHPHRMPKMIRSLKITPDIRNIKVIFVTQPRLNQNTLSGCSYNSNISMHDFTFWLINGSEVIQKTTSSPLSTAEKDLYNFPKYVIREFKPNTFYQCGVYNSKRMKGIELSKKIYTDIHPEFTNDPYLNGTKLQGCDYNADIPMQQYAYWLINGTIRMNGTSVHNSSSEISYRFPTLSILDYYPTTSYECILYHPHRMPKMIRSLKITPDIRNIKVIFVTQPRLNQNTLSGCSYNSNISMHDFTFWLINGSEVIQKTTSSPLSTAEKDLYNFPKYVIREFKPNTFYQCGVYNSKRMKGIELSKKIYTDIKPTFTQGPKWNGRALHNCKYQFKRTLQQYTFWLVNGTRRINASTIGTGKNENTGFEFPELYIEDFTPGITYQCGIYHPQRMTKPLLTDAFVPAFEDSNLIAGPKIFTKYPKTGGALILKGCIFYSKFPLANMKMFWMKNEKKVMANSTYIIKKNANYTYEIKSLIYNDTNHQQQGYYRCGLAVRGRPDVLSPKVDVQFVDVSESRLIFTVSGKWLKSYSDESSRQYKSLEKSLIKKISLLGNISTALQQKKFIQIMNLRRIVLQRDTIRVQARIIYAKVDETEQLQICMYMKSVLQREKYSTLHLISTRNYDCCLKHSVGDDHHKGMYHFNTTLVSNTVFIKCKYGERVINRTCIPDLYDGPKWSTLEFERCEKRPDTIEVLEKIAEQTICSSDNQNDCVTVQDTVEDLTNTVLKASMLKSPEEMDLVSHIISDLTTNIKVINTTQQAKEFIDKVLTCVDVVVTSPPHVVVASQNKWQTSTILLRNLDKMAVQLGNLITTTNDSISISKPNVGVNIAFVKAKDLTIELSNANGTVGVSFSSSNNQSNSNSQLIIPNETFKSKRELVYSFTYSSDMLFRRGQISSPQNNPTKIVNKKNRFKKSIDGHIVSASIGETKLANLTNPIILKFKKNDTQQGYQRNCHFWDFNINVQGEWSTEGCKYIKEDQSFVFCECDHLTNFALVLDVSQTFKNPLELKIITWIGCGISLAGLILTIITYISLKKLRAKLAPKLLICLCISLMLLLITFLIGAEQTQNRPICQSVAILLQFFTLTTFSWMAVEAYNLYRCFVRIFKSNTSDTQFLYKSSLVVWGLPALVVTATTAISPGNLGNDKVCVIYGAPFYFGLLLPVSLILLINFLTIYFVVTGINKASKTKSESKRKQQEKLHSTRVAFTCSVLLGLSWIFGVLAIGDLTEVFQWLFCIFNSLQGFFIFIFYTIKNKDAWHEWKKVFGLAPDNSFNSTLTRTKNGSKTGLYATTSNTSRIRADTLSTTLSRSPSSFVDDDEVAESSEELPGRISEHKL